MDARNLLEQALQKGSVQLNILTWLPSGNCQIYLLGGRLEQEVSY